MQRPAFRQVAAREVSSPEQLDQLMRITRPLGWLALLAIGGLIAAAVVWGILGQIPTQIAGEGILLRSGGVQAVAAPAAGQIDALFVQAGDLVTAGELVAELTDLAGGPRVQVLSPYRGRVVELAVAAGTQVERGTRLLSLVDEDQPLEAVIYLSPTDGKRVRAGMAAQVSPATTPKEEYGYLRGTVSAVGQFPSTYEGMFLILQNEDLVTALRAGGAPIEVRVTLVPDPAAPSGYRWTSPQGPPAPLGNGTPATALITIDERRPISLVLPFIR